MKMKWIALVAALLISINLASGVAKGQEDIPGAFYGSLTINGNPAPTGTQVEARGQGVLTGIEANPIITTEPGQYGSSELTGAKLIVQGEIAEGTILKFYVNGVDTGQTSPWHSESVTRLDLAVTISTPACLLLNEGWNLFSIPIAFDSSCDTWGELVALGDGLNIDQGAVTYYFDGLTQLWGEVLADYQLKPCDAIYVKMASADTVPIIPSLLPSVPVKQVYPAWNLVSLASLGDMNVAQAATSIYLVTQDFTGYSHIVSPPTNQPGWIHIRDSSGNPLMVKGKGYWVFMVNQGTLAGFSFTPL